MEHTNTALSHVVFPSYILSYHMHHYLLDILHILHTLTHVT